MLRIALVFCLLLAGSNANAWKGSDTVKFNCYYNTGKEECFMGACTAARSKDILLKLDNRNGTMTHTYDDGDEDVWPVIATAEAISWISKPTAYETRYTIKRNGLDLAVEGFYQGKPQSKHAGKCVITFPAGARSF